MSRHFLIQLKRRRFLLPASFAQILHLGDVVPHIVESAPFRVEAGVVAVLPEVFPFYRHGVPFVIAVADRPRALAHAAEEERVVKLAGTLSGEVRNQIHAIDHTIGGNLTAGEFDRRGEDVHRTDHRLRIVHPSGSTPGQLMTKGTRTPPSEIEPLPLSKGRLTPPRSLGRARAAPLSLR